MPLIQKIKVLPCGCAVGNVLCQRGQELKRNMIAAYDEYARLRSRLSKDEPADSKWRAYIAARSEFDYHVRFFYDPAFLSVEEVEYA